MANYSLIDTNNVPVVVNFSDTEGNPVAVTNVTMVVSDATLATLAFTAPTTAVSEVTANLAAVGPLGSFTLSVTATQPDGSTITGTQGVAITNGNAANVVFTFGAQVANAAPAAPTA